MKIGLTCAFVTWSDVVRCLHDRFDGMMAVLEHTRLWILNLLT